LKGRVWAGVVVSAIALASAVLSVGGLAASASAAGCANGAVRAEQAEVAGALPGCMALEMVSPPRKDAKPAIQPTISADGDRIVFRTAAALAGTPGVIGFNGDYYVAGRDAAGWSPAPTIPAGFARGWGEGIDALSFAPDLSRWLQLASTTATQVELGVGQIFEGSLGGALSPRSPLLVPLTGTTAALGTVTTAELKGVSSDRSHVFFSPGTSGTKYIAGDPTVDGANPNVYLAKLDSEGSPSLKLMARDSQGKVWNSGCGPRLGGGGEFRQGAVSATGALTYFSARPAQPAGESCTAEAQLNYGLRILERREAGQNISISPLIALPTGDCDRVTPEPACSTAEGDDLYRGASVDGTKIYLATNRQLADSDLDSGAGCASSPAGCDLYLFDTGLPAGQRLIQVSAGQAVPGKHEVGQGANVISGAVSVSGDGSHVYFAAQGILNADPNPEGDKAEDFPATTPKLYLYERDAGSLTFVGALSSSVDTATFRTQAYPVPLVGEDLEGHEVGGDGHVLMFQSRSQLTAVDGDGTRNDVFRYDGDTDQLACISCSPGATPVTPDTVQADVGERLSLGGGTDFAEQRRWASEDGETAIFKTPEALISGDSNGQVDSFLWRKGQLVRLPGTGGENSKESPVVSHTGDEVAYQTFTPLLPFDGDTALDVYVAREGGGFPFPQPPPQCTPDGAEACQQGASGAPSIPGVGSRTFVGPGNTKPGKTKPRTCPKGKRKVRRKGKVRCVKQRRRHASANRRAGK
jgi:hypothetical protein